MLTVLVYLVLFLVVCPGLERLFAVRPTQWYHLLHFPFNAMRALRRRRWLRVLVGLMLAYLALSPRVTPWPYEHFLFKGREMFNLDDASLKESMKSPAFQHVKLVDETWKTPHGALHVVRLVNEQGTIDVVVLFSQGIAGNIPGHRAVLELLMETGVREVVIYEPRGFGRSHFADWSPSRLPTHLGSLEHVSSTSMLDDGRDMLFELRRRQAGHARPIIWWGESFGASVVSYLATHEESGVAGIVLQSGFKSIAEVSYGGRKLPGVPFNPCRCFPRWLFPQELNTGKWLAGVHPPVLLIHGVKDTIVPYQHSVEAAATASAPCRLLILQQASHVTMTALDQPIAVQAVSEFMEGLQCNR